MVLESTELVNPMSFEQYYQLSQDKFAEGQTTSADPHYNTPEILEYAKVNLARMKRVTKTVVIEPQLAIALNKIEKHQTWYLLTESWCGDAAQLVALFNEMAKVSGNATLVVVLRDENLPLMDQFLTNGGRSIPKLIFTETTSKEVLTSWGPRPAAAQVFVTEAKAAGMPFMEMAEKLHGWYAQDATKSTQAEMIDLINALVQ
jgi:hypothetical protein